MSNIYKIWGISNEGTELAATPHYSINNFKIYRPTSNDNENILEELSYKFTFKLNEALDLFGVFTSIQSCEAFDLFLSEPEKSIDIIEKFEKRLRVDEYPLFMDLKTEYVVSMQVEFVCDTQLKKLVFLGFSIFEDEVDFHVKAFDYQGIRTVFECLVNVFTEEGNLKSIISTEHIKWIRQKQLQVFRKDKLEYKDNRKMLELSVKNSVVFSDLFSFLIKNGFIDRQMRQKLQEKLSPSDYNKTLQLLGKSLLLTVESNKISIMHNMEPININEDDEKTIYTLNPRLWQYFINDWYEEFIGEVIKKISTKQNSSVKVVSFCSGFEYNFRESKNADHKVEIDWLILLEKDNVYKLVAIECKRKMSNKIKKQIIEKYKEKIFDSSNYDLIDSFINVSFYSEKTSIEEEKLSAAGKVFFPLVTFSEVSFEKNIEKMEKAFELMF